MAEARELEAQGTEALVRMVREEEGAERREGWRAGGYKCEFPVVMCVY